MGTYRTYSIPGKTAAMVPEFAVEDLPLGRTAAQVPALAVKDLRLGRTFDYDDDDDDYYYYYYVILGPAFNSDDFKLAVIKGHNF